MSTLMPFADDEKACVGQYVCMHACMNAGGLQPYSAVSVCPRVFSD